MNLGSPVIETHPVGGGCIHRASRLLLADGRRVFLKQATDPAGARMLHAEARGLALLAPHIRVPRIIASSTNSRGDETTTDDSDDRLPWLALEWLELRPLAGPDAWASLGHALGALHRAASPDGLHGLDHPNFIGSTPQDNTPAASWQEFYLERRLRPQLELARASQASRTGRGHAGLPEAAILRRAGEMLADHHPAPALLHGDLWSGNTAALAVSADSSAADTVPDTSTISICVFDPAAYHGDPETDLAMLELFGPPLPRAFLDPYYQQRQLSLASSSSSSSSSTCIAAITLHEAERQRATRRPLYHLYHALNHLNLFGDSYVPMVRGCLAGMGIG